jgi:hypothetical protein
LAVAFSIAACGVLIPVVLALGGADYLAPRNLVGAMVPLSALIAVLATWPRTGSTGMVLGALVVLAFLAVSLDTERSPRLQRGNWRDLAHTIPSGRGGEQAITTVELGAAPLEFYIHGLHNLKHGSTVRLREIVETGYAPLRKGAGQPPAAGFRLLVHGNVDGLIFYRFAASSPRVVSEADLRRHAITLAHPEVLIPRPLG